MGEKDYLKAFQASKDVIQVGELKLKTGKLVACDIMALDAQPTPAFLKELEPGSYPVELSLAESKGQLLPSFAKVKFNDAPPVRWELALKEMGPIENAKEPWRPFAYFVETGFGGFMDLEAHEALIQNRSLYFKREIGVGEYDAPIHLALMKQAHQRDNFFYGHLELGFCSIVFFTSGYGDGFYKSFWGYDKNDQLVELITDFQVV